MSGRLEIVGTPIGNLADLSPRAIESLRNADVILCEDTRRTRALLSAAGIPGRGRLRAFHEHNEGHLASGVVRELLEGTTIALVSDAGMPAISDPGQGLIASAAEAGIVVTVIPGPSAVLSALVLSGLATDRFCMEGFLPRKGAARRAAIDLVASEQRTVVLFESPQRLRSLLGDLHRALGDARRVAVVRELTKLHEEVWRGTLAAATAHWEELEPRGEYVVVVDGAAPSVEAVVDDEVIVQHLLRSLEQGFTKRDAAQRAADELGVSRRRAYELTTSLP